MREYEITRLIDRPEIRRSMAQWFHEKWGIPMQAYLDSMDACLSGKTDVPQWYAVIEDGRIIAGLGVIENDFHDRKDLAPNVCAVYVEEEFRGRGVAGKMLAFAAEDMCARGVETLYLITDHIGFYERYGWEFLCMAREDGGGMTRMYTHRQNPRPVESVSINNG
jgi:GNAT superfamily N-acetyltransferase